MTHALQNRLIAFINDALVAGGGRVSAETPLFERGLLDSLQVLDLIAFVERETGRTLPDSAIRLANFRTPARIAETALNPQGARADTGRLWSRTRTRSSSRMRPDADIDPVVLEWARSLGAAELAPGALIDAHVLSRAGYLESFPNRAVFVDAGRERAIPPAACLHCYEGLAGQRLSTTPAVFTLRNRCARGDEVIDAEHGRLGEFNMREIVVIGSATQVERVRRRLMRQVQTFVTRQDLAATIEAATDPFHTSADRGKLALQRLRALKYELRMPVAGATVAVASFNDHEDYFGRAFDISLADGSPAHSGCIAFGLERWALAIREQTAEAAA